MSTPCDTIRDELIDLAKGEANAQAQAHLDTGCATCAEELEQLTMIVGLLGRMPAPLPEAGSRERVTAAAHAADWADTPEQTEAMVQVAGLLAGLPPVTPEPGFTERVVAEAQIADLLRQLPTPQPSPGAAKRVVAAALAADAAVVADPDVTEPSVNDSGIIKLSDYVRDRVRKAPIWAATIAVHAAAILVLASVAIAPGNAPVNPHTVAMNSADEAAKDPLENVEPTPAGNETIEIPTPTAPTTTLPIPDPDTGDTGDEFEDTEPPTLDPFGSSSDPHSAKVDRFKLGKAHRDLEFERKIRTQVLAWIGSRREDARSDAHTAAGTTSWRPHIARGLEWLRANQQPDGSWMPSKHGGSDDYRVGLSALALLAFAAEGHSATDGSDHAAHVVSKGVKYLWKQQDMESGRFGPDSRTHLYSHALAMMAIGETHALDILNYLKLSDSYSRHFLEKGVAYTVAAQRADGGWGYRPDSDQSDTSVTVWQIAALDVAHKVGIAGTETALRRARAWLQRVSDEQGRFGYHAAGDFPKGSPALAAAGKWGQLLLADAGRGTRADDGRAQLLLKNAPSTLGNANLYGWYYATLVLAERGGEDWGTWRDSLGKTVGDSQQADGSWKSKGDRFADAGGRLYATALNVLSLQAPARYSK